MLVVASALVAVAWTVVFSEARIDDTAAALHRSFYVAEGGALATIRNWSRSYNFIAPYPTDSVAIPSDFPASWLNLQHGNAAYGGYLYRLNEELYLLRTVGRGDRSPFPAFHELGTLLRLEPPRSVARAALEAGGSVQVDGPVRISGIDSAPPGWSCSPRDSSQAGIAAESIAILSPPGARITGQPPMAITAPEAEPARLRSWTALRDVLVTEPNHTLPGSSLPTIQPSVVGGHCAVAVTTNWGDATHPTAPCGAFYPVTHLTGDAVLGDVAGQGTLLVDGDLTLTGAVRWNGIILTGSNLTLKSSGPAIQIWGAMVAFGTVSVAADTLASSLEVTYSKCAITKALEAAASVVPLASRSSIEPF